MADAAYPKQVTGGHINSDFLLSRQAETYEAKLRSLGELLESEKQLALENQVPQQSRFCLPITF